MTHEEFLGYRVDALEFDNVELKAKVAALQEAVRGYNILAINCMHYGRLDWVVKDFKRVQSLPAVAAALKGGGE